MCVPNDFSVAHLWLAFTLQCNGSDVKTRLSTFRNAAMRDFYVVALSAETAHGFSTLWLLYYDVRFSLRKILLSGEIDRCDDHHKIN